MKTFLIVLSCLILNTLLLCPDALAENKAILIGISQYSDPDIHCLAYADEDIKTFASMLANYAGYSSRDLTVLLNSAATKQSIMNAIVETVRQSRKKPLDHVIIMFAGHGLPPHIQSNTTNSFLAPFDARVGEFYKESSGENSLVNNETFINKAWLSRQLANLNAREIVLILDSCYSGAKNFGALFTENLGFEADFTATSSSQRGLVVVKRKTATGSNTSKIAFLASSNENQPSAEYLELKHGALSYCIFEYLNAIRRNTVVTDINNVTVSSMFSNVGKLFDQVMIQGASLSSRHQPVLFAIPNFDSIAEMRFVSVRGNKILPIPPPQPEKPLAVPAAEVPPPAHTPAIQESAMPASQPTEKTVSADTGIKASPDKPPRSEASVQPSQGMPPQKTGRLEILTTPEQAEVYVDNVATGMRSNCILELPCQSALNFDPPSACFLTHPPAVVFSY